MYRIVSSTLTQVKQVSCVIYFIHFILINLRKTIQVFVILESYRYGVYSILCLRVLGCFT